jgi:hemolysin activation/secretion protein
MFPGAFRQMSSRTAGLRSADSAEINQWLLRTGDGWEKYRKTVLRSGRGPKADSKARWFRQKVLPRLKLGATGLPTGVETACRPFSLCFLIVTIPTAVRNTNGPFLAACFLACNAMSATAGMGLGCFCHKPKFEMRRSYNQQPISPVPYGIIGFSARTVWVIWWLFFFCCARLPAAEPAAPDFTAIQSTMDGGNACPRYHVLAYFIESRTLLSTTSLMPLLAQHTGTNVGLEEIVRAASDLQSAYGEQGFPTMNIIIAPKRITNGVVTMSIFPGAIPQIVVAGNRYLVSSNGVVMAASPPTNPPVHLEQPAVAAGGMVANTNPAPPMPLRTTPASPEEMAVARAVLMKEMADLAVKEKDTRIHVVSTNAGPRFEVQKYLVAGNSVLPPETIGRTLTNIDGAFGTNVSLDGIRTAATELQGAYRARGFVTVAVGLPPQKLTNATVKMQVTEGRLASILVKGNHYFSSNNVMRTLPSLHTNMILNGLIFQAELNQANASQDRQIYPVIDPGPEPGTSELTLKVKDRMPVHAKVELNNQSSPGTPELRLNTSAVYNNLWQLEHSFGFQYGFSPERFKTGDQWDFYDRPLVANYSAFYRMPLGNPKAVGEVVAGNPSFGYDEATRKFNLPPPSGQMDLTFFASRSTIDTGLNYSPNEVLASTSVTNFDQSVVTTTNLTKNGSQQDLTVNNNLGFRLNLPLPSSGNFHSSVSSGLDFKTYELTSRGTNIFTLNVLETDYAGNQILVIPVVSQNFSPLPLTVNQINYLPLAVRYDVGWRDFFGDAAFGLGLNANLWYSATTSKGSGTNTTYLHDAKSLQFITGSSKTTGHWVVLNPSFSHQFEPFTNWVTTLRADGQWSSEPLISNEQFGAGGVNSVRGYQEGEAFGDTGWHVSLEQRTAPHLVGPVYGNTPLIVRGLIYTDYARVFLMDPQGRKGSVALWGAGLGGVASIGSHWEARLMFSLPLLRTADTSPYQPFFNFGLTAQF